MSTKYIVSITDTNQRSNEILDTFLNSCSKFNSVDIVGLSRLNTNMHQRSNVRTVEDLNILRTQFRNNYNMLFITSFVEESRDIPKNQSFNQNLAEVDQVLVMANGNINNKNYLAKQYNFEVGTSLQEYILNFYNGFNTRFLNAKNFDIGNFVKEIQTDRLSFVIYDKSKNEIYVYNRGDTLFIHNTPGMMLNISSEIIPINSNIYPNHNYHKLGNNIALKIDTKGLFIKNVPIYSNTFAFGKDIMLDSNKSILFTEKCDMEYMTALYTLAKLKDVTNITDVQTVFFGHDSEIDKVIFDKIIKLRRLIKTPGKLPIHIPYNFNNIFITESEIINKATIESADNDSEDKPIETKVEKSITLRDTSEYTAKKLNFIAMSLINTALEVGVMNIIIPNLNRSNNRLISIVRELAKLQVNTPINVFTIFDELSTIDIIRYCISCREEISDIDNVLVNSNRNSITIEVDSKGKGILKYKSDSDYNTDIICGFQKCGLENPFEEHYIGNKTLDQTFINSNIVADKVYSNEDKVKFMEVISDNTKASITYQKKLYCC